VLHGVHDPRVKERFEGLTHRENMQLQIVAATWRIQTRSDPALGRITLVDGDIAADIMRNVLPGDLGVESRHGGAGEN